MCFPCVYRCLPLPLEEERPSPLLPFHLAQPPTAEVVCAALADCHFYEIGYAVVSLGDGYFTTVIPPFVFSGHGNTMYCVEVLRVLAV